MLVSQVCHHDQDDPEKKLETKAFLGAIIDVLGSYTDPVIRAMIATCVPQEELGKVYALIATAECIIPLIVSQAYASVFKVTQ